jgi:hypothetical protein
VPLVGDGEPDVPDVPVKDDVRSDACAGAMATVKTSRDARAPAMVHPGSGGPSKFEL